MSEPQETNNEENEEPVNEEKELKKKKKKKKNDEDKEKENEKDLTKRKDKKRKKEEEEKNKKEKREEKRKNEKQKKKLKENEEGKKESRLKEIESPAPKKKDLRESIRKNMWVSEDEISYAKPIETFSLSDHLLIEKKGDKDPKREKSRKEPVKGVKGNEALFEKWEDQDDEVHKEKYEDLSRGKRKISRLSLIHI